MGMRWLLALVVLLAVACGGSGDAPTKATQTSKVGNATDVVNALKAKGLPFGEMKVFDATTDPNSMLGRPNQYTSKTNFQIPAVPSDKRDPSDPFTVSNGGAVEVFANEADATARKEVLQAYAAINPEYQYQNGKILLRLSHFLTPDQATPYEAALKALKV